MSINLDYIVKARSQITETAQCMLDGGISYIEGSRLICGLLEPARLERRDAPFVVFVAVDSETDDVPIGEVRDTWHPDGKIKFAQEWANAEQYAKTIGEAACKDAILWFVEHPYEPS